jgi:D-arginine dehydrogenase
MRTDVLVIGAGIAGTAAAFFLAAKRPRRIVVLERESQPGYHTTGRSAAMFIETYGNATVRALTKASGRFFHAPPQGFAAHPLVAPRGALVVARPDQMAALEKTYSDGRALTDRIVRLDVKDAIAEVPVLRADYVAGALFEPDAKDIDVGTLHQGFIRGIKAMGGSIIVDAEVKSLERRAGFWRIGSSAGAFDAPIIVNAAGAWCDAIARLAGLEPIGLVPKRRTAITFDPPANMDVRAWPIAIDVEENFYFKPDAGRLLASPADETPMPPCDVRPEDIDVANLVAKLERATTLVIPRIRAKWAGLRSFVADNSPVAGYAPSAPGFFWFAGQGGFGIQTAPALARLAAGLIDGEDVPADIAALGVRRRDLAPERLDVSAEPRAISLNTGRRL